MNLIAIFPIEPKLIWNVDVDKDVRTFQINNRSSRWIRATKTQLSKPFATSDWFKSQHNYCIILSCERRLLFSLPDERALNWMHQFFLLLKQKIAAATAIADWRASPSPIKLTETNYFAWPAGRAQCAFMYNTCKRQRNDFNRNTTKLSIQYTAPASILINIPSNYRYSLLSTFEN